MGKVITKPKLLLVEGKDEVYLFNKLLSDLTLENIEVRDVGGKSKFANRLKVLFNSPNHENITSVGIIRDADTHSAGAFASVCDALHKAGLPTPTIPLQSVGNLPQVMIMIIPGGGQLGMLEDLCLASVVDDPAMACVERYFECLKEQIDLSSFPGNLAKAKVRAFLAAMEWGEETYFESIQKYLKIQPADAPSVAQAHTFLASRYKPNLDLGIAAQRGYWKLDHPTFDQVKQFLKQL